MSLECRLHLSLDPVAAFRGLRDSATPEPVAVALLAELAGVRFVSMEARDQRRARDVRLLRETLSVPVDLALAPTLDPVGTAFEVRPDRLTLVPEQREGGSAAGGLDAHLLRDALKKHVTHLRDAEIEVGVRIEPGLEQVKALHRCDANVAVLHGGGLLRARGPAEQRAELVRLRDAASLAHKLNLRVAVAGGVDLRAAELLAQVPQISELHLGHACLARALLVGIERAVSDFAEAVARGRRQAD